MNNFMTASHEMISDDTPMASPPDGLGTHQRHATIIREVNEVLDCRLEVAAQRIVGVVMEALDASVSVQRRIHIILSFPSAAKFIEVSVGDVLLIEQIGEGIDVECRIGAGAGESPDIGQHVHFSCCQHGNDSVRIPIGMADRENGWHQLFSFVTASSLWAAT